ncbi:MAG: flagellar basal body P-ring formation chaperone FlgA [Limisphaerales bacterium]
MIFRAAIPFLLAAALAGVSCLASLPPVAPTTAPSAVLATNTVLDEAAVTKMLTDTLRNQFIGNDGDLDLHFTRPWTVTNAPAGPLTMRILEMPAGGVTANFIVRFQVFGANGSQIGDWQMPAQAHLWRQIFVARSMLKPGQLVADADIGLERRDVLALHAPLAQIARDDTAHEIAESVPAGSPIYDWSVKLHPVIHRGQLTTARLEDGALVITMKVEALQDGTPGQIIRLRNLDSDHDFSGTVLDEATVQVSL